MDMVLIGHLTGAGIAGMVIPDFTVIGIHPIADSDMVASMAGIMVATTQDSGMATIQG